MSDPTGPGGEPGAEVDQQSGGFPPRDRPGSNVQLSPEHAPRWLRRLVDNVAAGRVDFGPGRRAEKRMGQASAVLLALRGTGEEDAELLLTHRNPRMRSHPGQIAFPGGRIDPADTGAVDAALREAWEETGLDRCAVTPLAQLGAVSVTHSAQPVYPVLAHWHTPAVVGVASPEEADHVFLAPLVELAAPENRVMVSWGPYRGPAFRHAGYLIWGFTAAVIDQLLALGGWERAWDGDIVRELGPLLESSRNEEPAR